MLDPLDLGEGGELLNQPTRARLFQLLGELRRAATTQELAASLGLNPNGVRCHLERMAQAGLLERRQRRGGRGRPADLWQLPPHLQGVATSSPLSRRLGVWLAQAVAPTQQNLSAVEEEGRRVGVRLAATAGGQGREGLLATLTALGFAPIEESKEGAVCITLRNCPFREAALANGPLVCSFHRGITQGLLYSLWSKARLDGFHPAEPRQAGCRVELRLGGGS